MARPDGDWPRYAGEIDAGEIDAGASVAVPIAPPGWSFSCARKEPGGLRWQR